MRPRHRHVGPASVEVARHTQQRRQPEPRVEGIALAPPQHGGEQAHAGQAGREDQQRQVVPAALLVVQRYDGRLWPVTQHGEPTEPLALDRDLDTQFVRAVGVQQSGRQHHHGCRLGGIEARFAQFAPALHRDAVDLHVHLVADPREEQRHRLRAGARRQLERVNRTPAAGRVVGLPATAQIHFTFAPRAAIGLQHGPGGGYRGDGAGSTRLRCCKGRPECCTRKQQPQRGPHRNRQPDPHPNQWPANRTSVAHGATNATARAGALRTPPRSCCERRAGRRCCAHGSARSRETRPCGRRSRRR